jgi:DNA-binding beta-propeller fold protein YncE
MAIALWALDLSQGADRIIRYDPKKEDALELFRQGYELYSRGRYEEAIAAFDRSLASYPGFARTHFWKARAYYRLAKSKLALDELFLAARPDPEPYPEDIDERRQRAQVADDAVRWMSLIEVKEKGETEGGDLGRYTHAKTISGRSFGKGGFYTPTDLYIDSSGNIYVVSFGGNKVVKLDANGRFLMKIGGGRPSLKPGQFDKPHSIALDSKGNIYVSDFGNNRVQKFSPEGVFLNQFGKIGLGDGELIGPEGLAVDPRDNLYVADSGNNRVQKFDPTGSFLMKFGAKGEGEGRFLGPSGIVVKKDGGILVSDFGGSRIQEFDSSGNYLREFGRSVLTNPRGIAIDAYDNIYAATNDGFVHRFSPAHEHTLSLNSWSVRGEARSFMVPSDVAIDIRGFLYVADYENSSLEAFVPEAAKIADLAVTINRTETDSFPLIVNHVLVWGEDDKPISGLTKENFTVRENGVQVNPIEVIPMDVEKEQARTSIALVVETTSDMRRNRGLLEAIVENITKGLGRNDVVSLIESGRGATERLGFMADHSSVARTLGLLSYRSPETALYDSLHLAIRKSMDLLGKRAIILLTSSDRDQVSVHSPEEVLLFSRINYVPIYVIDFGESQRLLELATKSGGSYYDARRSGRIKDIGVELSNMPLNQYIVVYQTSELPRRNRWRDVTIDVDYNGLRGTDRAIYWGP